MTDHFPPEAGADDLGGLFDDPTLMSLLGDDATWEAVDPVDEAAILAAIGEIVAESGTRTSPNVDSSIGSSAYPAAAPDVPEHQATVTELSFTRRWTGPILAGAAAAVLVFAGLSLRPSTSEKGDVELSLAPTELAPGASGNVEVFDTANGTRLLLDVSGLSPAPAGQYYEAWLRQDATVGVSAGTFHLRGGGGEIELWAGVTTEQYPLITVTLQDEADTASSGKVVLKGRLEN